MTTLRGFLSAAALACALAMMPGCSSQPSSFPPPDLTTQSSSAPPVVTQATEPDSLLGATLHLVGTAVLLPFRLVGDALGLLV